MPAAWSPKDERQYGHILASCRKQGRYGVSRCKSIAAATVNKNRRRQGRTLSGLSGIYSSAPLAFAAMAGVMLLGLVNTAKRAQAQTP